MRSPAHTCTRGRSSGKQDDLSRRSRAGAARTSSSAADTLSAIAGAHGRHRRRPWLQPTGLDRPALLILGHPLQSSGAAGRRAQHPGQRHEMVYESTSPSSGGGAEPNAEMVRERQSVGRSRRAEGGRGLGRGNRLSGERLQQRQVSHTRRRRVSKDHAVDLGLDRQHRPGPRRCRPRRPPTTFRAGSLMLHSLLSDAGATRRAVAGLLRRGLGSGQDHGMGTDTRQYGKQRDGDCQQRFGGGGLQPGDKRSSKRWFAGCAW